MKDTEENKYYKLKKIFSAGTLIFFYTAVLYASFYIEMLGK